MPVQFLTFAKFYMTIRTSINLIFLCVTLHLLLHVPLQVLPVNKLLPTSATGEDWLGTRHVYFEVCRKEDLLPTVYTGMYIDWVYFMSG